MVALGAPPVRLLLATLCLVIAVGATWRGARLLGKGLRHVHHPSGSLWVVRGLRGAIIAVCGGAVWPRS